MSDFEIYANVTKIYNMNKLGVFIIFLDNLGICRNPKKNVLNLEFDSKTVVKCQHSIYVNEWYSLDSKSTITTNFLKWSIDQSRYELLLNKTFYERRNSLQGIELRVFRAKVLFNLDLFLIIKLEITKQKLERENNWKIIGLLNRR